MLDVGGGGIGVVGGDGMGWDGEVGRMEGRRRGKVVAIY